MKTLTPETAKNGLIIICKEHPDWGFWRMRFYDKIPETWEIEGERGKRLLFESEFHFWEIP